MSSQKVTNGEALLAAKGLFLHEYHWNGDEMDMRTATTAVRIYSATASPGCVELAAEHHYRERETCFLLILSVNLTTTELMYLIQVLISSFIIVSGLQTNMTTCRRKLLAYLLNYLRPQIQLTRTMSSYIPLLFYH